jgi:hypothetical protein
MAVSDLAFERVARILVSAALYLSVIFAAVALGPSAARAADPTWTFYSESHVDDPIGDGRTFYATSGGSVAFRPDPFGRSWIDVTCCGSTVHWAHQLRLPSDSRLVAGDTYEGSVEVRGPIAGYGGSCSSDEASVSAFDIHAVDYDPEGNLSLLSMSVRQRCGAGDYRAEVRLNTSSPAFAAVLPSANPFFSFDVSRLQFPPTAIGSTSPPMVIELTNVGALPVAMGAASTTGVDGADFRVSDGDCSGRQMATGQTCTLALRFEPTARGERQARASIVFDTPAGGKQWLIGGYGQVATTTTIEAPAAPVLSPVRIGGRVQTVSDDLPGACYLYLRQADATMGGIGAPCDETGRAAFEQSLSAGRHRLHVAFEGTTDFASSRSPDVTVDVIREQDWATVSVSPAMFYPVPDQYRDRLSVEGTRHKPVEVDIDIRSVATDEIVREATVPAATGDYAWWWDGTGDAAMSPLVDPGKYDVIVTLSDSVPNVRVITNRITLSHDYVAWADRDRVTSLDGRDFTLWGWSKDARISVPKSVYTRGVRLVSNKGFAGVIFVFPVDTKQLIGPMRFEAYGRSTNKHKAILAVWDPALGDYKSFANYDVVKLAGPREGWWRTGFASEGRTRRGKVRATVAVWRGLGGPGSSAFDIKSVRLSYKVGTLHAADGASITALHRDESWIGMSGRRVGSMTSQALPPLEPAPTREPEQGFAPAPEVVPDQPPDAEGQPPDAEQVEPTPVPDVEGELPTSTPLPVVESDDPPEADADGP